MATNSSVAAGRALVRRALSPVASVLEAEPKKPPLFGSTRADLDALDKWGDTLKDAYRAAMHQILDCADQDHYVYGWILESFGTRDAGEDPEEYKERLPTHGELDAHLDSEDSHFVAVRTKRLVRSYLGND